jgi:transposase-like protein
LGGENHPPPRVINTDKHTGYPPAIAQLKAEGHRTIKRRVRASQHFRSFSGAWRTIAGYEAIHMIRKGQVCWSAKVGLLHGFILGLFTATS